MIHSETAARQWIANLSTADGPALARLDRFVELLRSENEVQNLVSANSLSQVWQRHIVDSLQLLLFVPRETSSWLDLGTGAGFPGLVIAIMRPDLQMTLVESRTRRVDWLSRAADALGLSNVYIEGQRLELVDTRPFDVISARAFAPLDTLLHLAQRFSTAQTTWILPKGRSAAQELAALRFRDHTFHVEQSITDADGGIITGRLSNREGSPA